MSDADDFPDALDLVRRLRDDGTVRNRFGGKPAEDAEPYSPEELDRLEARGIARRVLDLEEE